MNQELDNRLRHMRPSLFLVAPLTYCICWGYAVVNILLGVGLFEFYQPVAPIAIANILTYPQWGVLFFLAGIIGVYSLLTNRWKLAQNIQFVGVLIKSVWAIALVVRCFSEPSTLVITAIWLFLTFIQVVTYIFFVPKPNSGEKKYEH